MNPSLNRSALREARSRVIRRARPGNVVRRRSTRHRAGSDRRRTALLKGRSSGSRSSPALGGWLTKKGEIIRRRLFASRRGRPQSRGITRERLPAWPVQERAFRRGLDPLKQLASGYGIQTSYIDMEGDQQRASPATLKAVLGLLGVTAGTQKQIREALLELELGRWRQPLPPVTVAWDGKPTRLPLRLPANLDRWQTCCRLRLEDGTCKTLDWDTGTSAPVEMARLDDRTYITRQLLIPALPFGYHNLEFEITERRHTALLIAAPAKSYAPPGKIRDWGIFLPMYAAHSARSWGAGNFHDFEQLARWTAEQGGRVVGTLPLLAVFLGGPVQQPSPYCPVSRLFWNEFYIDPTRAPEFSRCAEARRLVASAGFQKRLARFRAEPLVDYAPQMQTRRNVLELLARDFFRRPSARFSTFQRFLGSRPALVDYAEFRAACEQTGAPWHRWESRMRLGKLQPGDFSQQAKHFHLYAQWLAQEQLEQLLGTCRKADVRLYLDLPLGVHPDGYDLWRQNAAFAFPASAGAPPDPCFTKGQNWGFAPLHPRRIRERRYEYVLDFLRFQMHAAGMLRLDHIMALHRLYWIPPGATPDQGAYVSYPAEELYAILSLESHRHKTILMGENLGTVPPEVNAAMARHRVRQSYVVQYEARPFSARVLRQPPACSVAGLNTHDMPTFQSFWRGQDITDRANIGLIPRSQVTARRKERQRLAAALAGFFIRKDLLSAAQAEDAAAVLRACLKWLGASPAEVLLINLEDLWLEGQPQNLPGTTNERPNWRRKARHRVEDLSSRLDLRWLTTNRARGAKNTR